MRSSAVRKFLPAFEGGSTAPRKPAPEIDASEADLGPPGQ